MRRAVLTSICFVFVLCAPAFAQSADEVVKKVVDARGGADKMRAIVSMRITATSHIIGGMVAPTTILLKRPSMFRQEMNLMGKSAVTAFDGASAWTLDALSGAATPVPSDEMEMFTELSDMDGPLVDYKAKGSNVELVGREDLDGAPVYRLTLTFKDGSHETIFIDAKSFLPLREVMKMKLAGMESEVETNLSDYRPVNGVLVAYTTETKVDGKSLMRLTYDKVEANVSVDDAIFKIPSKPVGK